MATPHVAGIAALIIGKADRGKLTPAQVGAVIRATAQKLPCPQPEPYIPRVCLVLGLTQQAAELTPFKPGCVYWVCAAALRSCHVHCTINLCRIPIV